MRSRTAPGPKIGIHSLVSMNVDVEVVDFFLRRTVHRGLSQMVPGILVSTLIQSSEVRYGSMDRLSNSYKSRGIRIRESNRGTGSRSMRWPRTFILKHDGRMEIVISILDHLGPGTR